MFKCINKGNFSTHTHTQVRFAEQKIVAESGRSMVEILGTLAIIGILSMVGIKAFNAGMTQHRANELINEAQKRAVVVAAQIMAGGDNLSVAEFKNPEGYTFGVEKNPANPNQFNITLMGVKTDVCTKMKAMVDTSSVVRVISVTCDKLTFNNNLSYTAYGTDYGDSTSCASAGFTWCTKGDDGLGTKCSESTNCCASITYNTQCQVCDVTTGEVTNKADGASCLYNNQASICNSGFCLDPEISTTTKCLTNADCGGENSGYYCRYASYDADTYCTDDAPTAIGCAGQTPATCSNAGTCTQVGSFTKVNVQGLGHVIVGEITGTWWNVNSWCTAQGKSLIPIEAFQVYYSGQTLFRENSGRSSYACKQGKYCGRCDSGQPANAMWENNGRVLTDARDDKGELYREKYSPVFLALAQLFRGQKNAFFTSSNVFANHMCNAYLVDLNMGLINTSNRSYQSSRALCR